jgi:hypothetical protein
MTAAMVNSGSPAAVRPEPGFELPRTNGKRAGAVMLLPGGLSLLNLISFMCSLLTARRLALQPHSDMHRGDCNASKQS